jgi:hypothetical protein
MIAGAIIIIVATGGLMMRFRKRWLAKIDIPGKSLKQSPWL